MTNGQQPPRCPPTPMHHAGALMRIALIATCLILGAVIYYGGKAWRASQGIDLSLNYLEIPPE